MHWEQDSEKLRQPVEMIHTGLLLSKDIEKMLCIGFKKENYHNLTENLVTSFDDGNYKKKTNIMHLAGWEDKYLKSSGASMMGNGCSVSLFTHLYDKTIKI